MNYCDICGEECGEYTLCPDCFEKMQNGEIKQCQNCHHWYLTGTICSCVRSNFQHSSPPRVLIHNTSNNTNYQETHRKSHNMGCFITFLLLACIVVGIFLAINHSYKKETNTNTNVISAITKKEPSISCSDPDNLMELNQLKFNIYCNDNYDKVVISFTLYDKNGAIIKEDKLTGQNYKKGNTYTLSYSLSMNEIFKTDKYTYKIYEYK